MKLKPMIFSAESIRAIRAGRKTQTRRIIKPQFEPIIYPGTDGKLQAVNIRGKSYWLNSQKDHPRHVTKAAPLQPGDIVWGKETWQVTSVHYDGYTGGYEAGYPLKSIPKEQPPQSCIWWAADGDEGPWRSPLFMPRWAARTFLRVTDVRCERLWEISEEDSIAELGGEAMGICTTKVHFQESWDSINRRRGFPWESNCWVWAYTFAYLPDAQTENAALALLESETRP